MRHPPFLTPQTEMTALQKYAEYYSAKINALNLTRPRTQTIRNEIKYLESLNQGCQASIAFYFTRNIHPL